MKIQSWTFAHAILMIVTTAIAAIQHTLFVMNLAMVISICVFVISNRNLWIHLQPPGGFANYVTLARFLLLILAIIIKPELHPLLFVALIVLVMMADGLDGYLARRLNQTTQFGATFDMEVDAFLALVLSFFIWKMHPDAPWVLIAGLLRYIFVLLFRILGWHERTTPAMPEAKVIAVIFFISLLIPFVLDWQVAFWLVNVGCVLVGISFLREFYLISNSVGK